LNRYPHLKSFLKEFEAEEYLGVSVEYVKGRPAVLYLFVDGEFKEDIDLHEYGSKEDLHSLMLKKGFKRMTTEEVAVMRQRKEVERLEEFNKKLALREIYREESRKRREAQLMVDKRISKEDNSVKQKTGDEF
jgi:Sep15/SelM redox domain